MNKRGFIMWGDFLKGALVGLVIGIAVVLLLMSGMVPIAFDLCGMVC